MLYGAELQRVRVRELRTLAMPPRPRCLFVVEDIFAIRGRGLVPVPGIVPQGDERFRVGDTIMLKRPDGSVINTRIGGLELACPIPRHDLVILLRDLSKEDVPIGTEVWSMAPNDEAQARIDMLNGL